MSWGGRLLGRILRSPDLRILIVAVIGVGLLGIVDGTRLRTLSTPTIAYKPAFLFGLALVYGWRGLAWSQLVIFLAFESYDGWRTAIFLTPLFTVSHVLGLVASQRLGRGQVGFSREQATIALLVGAVLAPAVPSLLQSTVLRLIGVRVGPGIPEAFDVWVRGSAAILALLPAMLVYGSGPLRRWAGLARGVEWRPLINRLYGLELLAEAVMFAAILWISVEFKAHYGLNVTYLTFLPPLAFILIRGMSFAALALPINAVIATTVWLGLNWAGTLSAGDLRLLILIYSLTILVLAAVVDARQRSQVEVETLRAAKTALRLSEERFRFAQKAASIGTFDWNVETGATTWTPELEALYGLPPGGFPGTHEAFESLVHPDDRPRVLQRASESLETGAPAAEEWRVVWPDGSLHWIAGRWQLQDAPDEPRHVLGINIDVTDRKNIEEALRKGEERFRLATKATNDAIYDIDLKAGTVSWNNTYAVLFGRPNTADSWQFWIDRIHHEDRARTVDEFQAALGSGATTWSREYRFRRADGEWAHIYDRAYIARDPSGAAWRVIGAMQDLTEQKKAESALRESEERFRRVFEEGPLGLALVGKDYRFLKVNDALCKMTGYDEVELVPMSFVDITHPDDVRTDVELAAKLFKREIPFYRIQKRYLKKNGEIIWINLTASLIHGPDGEPQHGLAMIEDITEIKRTQEEALFRQNLESLGTLAGGIAHDFNNLLGAIRAQAELASGELDAGSSCREELKAIGEVAVRGSEIVRQLMIYAGKESTVVGLIDLSKTVSKMFSLLSVSVSKHAVVNAELDQDLPGIYASAAQIQQIVMNLITNASDAIGDRDGVIRVITRRVMESDLATISSATPPDSDYVQLEVSDNGRGMSPETKARMFDPFFSTKSAGRGLGLAVVQGIVRSLCGAIRITSEPDKGTTVLVLLPCAKTPARTTSLAISTDGNLAVPSPHAAILVVEDEADLCRAVVKMLRQTGFEVFEAGDGNSAIDLFRKQGRRIDTILLDMTLPGPGGREIVAEAAKVKPEIKVILTSAYSQEMIEGSMTAPQIYGFIRKPFSFADLLKIIRSSLSS